MGLVHDLPISVIDRVIWPFCEDFPFKKLCICEVSLKQNPREKFIIYSIILFRVKNKGAGQTAWVCRPVPLGFACIKIMFSCNEAHMLL